MSYPAILIPDHFEVALVRSNSGLTGKTKQIIDLNGGHIQSHHQMRGAGGIAKVNDLGLMSIIGIEKTLLLRGTITQSDDSHKRENSARIDTSLIRSLGANIVNAAPLIEAIRELPSPYIEQLRPEQQINIQKIFEKLNIVLNLNAVAALPSAETIITKQIETAITDLLQAINETFPHFTVPSQNIFLSALKTVEPIIIQHQLSVDIQNSVSSLEREIIQFTETPPASEIKLENNIFSSSSDIIQTIEADAIEIKETDTENSPILIEDEATIVAPSLETDIATVSPEPDQINTDIKVDTDIASEEIVTNDNISIESETIPASESENIIESEAALTLDLMDDVPVEIGDNIMPVQSENISTEPTAESSAAPNADIAVEKITESTADTIAPIQGKLNDSSYMSEINFISPSNPQTVSIAPETNLTSQPIVQNIKTSSQPAADIKPHVSLTTPTLIAVQNTVKKSQTPIHHQSVLQSATKSVSTPVKPVISTAKSSFTATTPQKPNHTPVIAPQPRAQTTLPQVKKVQAPQTPITSRPAPAVKQALSVPIKPNQPLRNTPSQPPILKRIAEIPRSLNRSQIIIHSILKPSSSQKISVPQKIANNNQPSTARTSTQRQATIPTPSDPSKPIVRNIFKVSTNIVTETVKTKAQEFYQKIKANPAAQAVCAISGGICRCSEAFNKAVRGHVDKATRKILEQKNISETQFIDDAKAQQKTSEVIRSLSKPEATQQDRKDNEMILRPRNKPAEENNHIHGPWCKHAPPQDNAKLVAVILPTQQAADQPATNTEQKPLTARELRAMAKQQSQLNVK